MNDREFITRVAQRAGTDVEGAGAITYAVFQELRERITPKEAFDVASQLPIDLQVLWLENERIDRGVRKTHETEFVARVRYYASLADLNVASARGARGLRDVAGSARQPQRHRGRGLGHFQPVAQGPEEAVARGARRARLVQANQC